jgi:hypothetical protein
MISKNKDGIVETYPTLRNKKRTRLARHCPDTDTTDLPGGRQPRSAKVRRVYLEPPDNGKAKTLASPQEFEDDLTQGPKNDRNRTANKPKGYKPKLAPVDENDTDLIQEAEEPEQMKPTSQKRRPDARDSDRDGGTPNGSNQPEALRKRPKAAQRKGSDPAGERVAFTIKAPEHAPKNPISGSHCILTPLTDIPASKKRSRVASHEDAQIEPFIEKPRKRMKAMLTEDQPATATREKKAIKSSSGQVEQGEHERKV